MYKKLTMLRNYYATSDPDEFCFDKHRDAEEHYEERIKEYHEGKESDRVYMQDLLPKEHQHQQGHWRIVVEFIPTGKED